MKMTVCCENVYAVAMETACRHSKQELIFMYLSNINQIRVVFILSKPKFSLTHGYVKYAPALLHCLMFAGIQKCRDCHILKITYLRYRNKIWAINR